MNSKEILLFECIKENYESPNRIRFMSLTEAEKVSVARNLVDKIYVNIAEKYNQVDFGSVPESKGYIVNMSEYKNLKASIELLKEIAKSSKQTIPEIEILSTSLNNIQALGERFYMGFVKKNAGVIMLYNLLTMSLYCGTSLMISVLVDYVNMGNTDSVEVIINRKYKKNTSYLMITTLAQFNNQVKDGSFSKNLDTLMRPEPVNESAGVVAGSIILAAGLIIGIFKIIPLIKELIYLFYYSRMKLSEAAAIQANLVNANIQNLQSTGTATPKMISIQKWFADKLMDISHFFAFKYEKSEKQAEAEAKTKITQSDIVLF